jgi:hypothetical protein
MNAFFDETQPTQPCSKKTWCLCSCRAICEKDHHTRNVSHVGRLLQSGKKAASQNVSPLLRPAQKVSHSASHEIAEAIELFSSKVVNKDVI